MNSNRSLAERASDALEAAAHDKAVAHRLRALAERTYDICFLKATGSNAEQRKVTARAMSEHVAADRDATEAEACAIVTKAKADAAMLLFEEWRTNEATRRQDTKFIAATR